MVYPKFCYGNEFNHYHARACRPGRPLCRFMRKVRPQRRACGCDAYHFPHRFGGGRCNHPDRMWVYLYGQEAVEEAYDKTEREGLQNDSRPNEPFRSGAFLEASNSDIPF